MNASNQVRRLQERLRRLRKALGETGWIIQGSILRRTIERDDPQRPGNIKTYGPYFQWTRKVAGRTVIQNLTPAQARLFGKAIRDNRKLEKTLEQMRAASLKLLELGTEGVTKRRRGR